ncbi:MAG: tetratricopeptide repeat protein [Rhizobiaceae bacterium]|nr:tetratricopeptide repeat protein [Rhizobiaceae bacterium]
MKNLVLRSFKTALLATALLTGSSLGFASADLNQTVVETGLSGSYLASRVAMDDNDDEAAVKFLEKATSLDSDDLKIRQDYFAALVANGRISDAAKIAQNTEKLGTRRNLAGYVIAAEEMRQRSWKKAATALKDVAGVELDKTLREIMLAWINAGERNFEEAQVRINDLTGPEWITVMKNYHTGLIASMAGETDVAQENFQRVIENRAVITVLTETYIRSIEAMVRTQSKAGETEKASATLQAGLDIFPSHPPFISLKAKLDAGETLGDLITTPQEGAAEIFFNLASAIERDGVGAITKGYLQIANHLAPESDVILLGLAELYLRQGYYERSNTFYDRISKQSSFERIARLEKATNLSRLEQKSEAITELQKLIDEDPKDLAGYMTLGSLFNREKRYREGAEVFDAAVKNIGASQRHHWNLFFRRGISYERLKEWEKAEPNFVKSLELSPDQPEVLNYLGYSWIDQGINLDEGMEMIRKAVELRPRSGFIVDSLGWAHYRLGNYEEAVKQLERAVQLMPQDPTINDHLGDAYWKVGRKLEATFQWKIALASETEPEDPKTIEAKLANGLIDDEESEAKAE